MLSTRVWADDIAMVLSKEKIDTRLPTSSCIQG